MWGSHKTPQPAKINKMLIYKVFSVHKKESGNNSEHNNKQYNGIPSILMHFFNSSENCTLCLRPCNVNGY